MAFSTLVHVTRKLAERYIWTHPSIAQSFRCRPTYQASFKTCVALMWGGEPNTASAGVGRCSNFGGESVLLLNVRASAIPAGCRSRVR